MIFKRVISLYYFYIKKLSSKDVNIEESWKLKLQSEFSQPYFDNIRHQLRNLKSQGRTYYPPGNLIFNAFQLTPFNKVKVVIIGQDPYHNPGQAMGLSFSVPRGIKTPPSLVNIYKEIMRDLNLTMPNHGDLTHWADQGVFLLNAMLTVEHNSPGSHKKIGWQNFTDKVIQTLSEDRENLIFLLWGNFARKKKQLIDETKHYVLEAAHPSPLARNAFSGCAHFSKANEILIKNHQKPIDWQIQ